MKTIPVFDFGWETQIGEMTIDETKLPNIPSFVFSCGGQAIRKDETYVDFELESIALVLDSDYPEIIKRFSA